MEKEEESLSWLTEELVKQVFKKEKAKLKDVDVTRAAGKGESHTSPLHRLRMGDKYVVAKERPGYDFFDTVLNVFEKEKLVYQKIIPEMEKRLGHPLAPKYLYATQNVLFLEDLSKQGYKVGDRLKQLSLPQAKAALIAIAKFHAASAVVIGNPPKDEFNLVTVEDGFVENIHPVRNQILSGAYQWASCVVQSEPELHNYTDQVKRVQDTFWTDLVRCMRPSTLQVLNHGDFWTNNIMFKDTKEGLSVLLIDFQMPRWGTPAQDIAYISTCSLSEELRETKLPELLDVYVDEFNRTILSLDPSRQGMSREWLLEELARLNPYVFLTFSMAMPVQLADDLDLKEEGNIANVDGYSHMYHCKLFRKLFKGLIKRYFDKPNSTCLADL